MLSSNLSASGAASARRFRFRRRAYAMTGATGRRRAGLPPPRPRGRRLGVRLRQLGEQAVALGGKATQESLQWDGRVGGRGLLGRLREWAPWADREGHVPEQLIGRRGDGRVRARGRIGGRRLIEADDFIGQAKVFTGVRRDGRRRGGRRLADDVSRDHGKVRPVQRDQFLPGVRQVPVHRDQSERPPVRVRGVDLHPLRRCYRHSVRAAAVPAGQAVRDARAVRPARRGRIDYLRRRLARKRLLRHSMPVGVGVAGAAGPAALGPGAVPGPGGSYGPWASGGSNPSQSR